MKRDGGAVNTHLKVLGTSRLGINEPTSLLYQGNTQLVIKYIEKNRALL